MLRCQYKLVFAPRSIRTLSLRPFEESKHPRKNPEHPENPGEFAPKGTPDAGPAPSTTNPAGSHQPSPAPDSPELSSAALPPDEHGVFKKLQEAGASVEHLAEAAHAWAADKIGPAVAKLPKPLQAAVAWAWYAARVSTKASFAAYIAGQKMAETISRQQGSTPEQARRLRGILAMTDLATWIPFSVGLGAVGLGATTVAVGQFLPAVSGAYLAYATARHPIATAKAAVKLVKGLGSLAKKAVKSAHAAGVFDHMQTRTLSTQPEAMSPEYQHAARIARDLRAHKYDDWYIALLTAAMGETGDVRQAIKAAGEAYREHPQSIVPEGEVEDLKTLATAHSPAGGITIKGRFYPGGRFIENGHVEKMTPAQRSQLEWRRDLFDPEDWTAPSRQKNIFDEIPDDAPDPEEAKKPDLFSSPNDAAKKKAHAKLLKAWKNHDMSTAATNRWKKALEEFKSYVQPELAAAVKKMEAAKGRAGRMAIVKAFAAEHGIDQVDAEAMLGAAQHEGLKMRGAEKAPEAKKAEGADLFAGEKASEPAPKRKVIKESTLNNDRIKGVSIKVSEGDHEGHRIASAYAEDGAFIGNVTAYKNDGGKTWTASNAHINEPFRRKGVATALYDALEETGSRMVPENRSGKQTKEAEAFWTARGAAKEKPVPPVEEPKPKKDKKPKSASVKAVEPVKVPVDELMKAKEEEFAKPEPAKEEAPKVEAEKELEKAKRKGAAKKVSTVAEAHSAYSQLLTEAHAGRPIDEIRQQVQDKFASMSKDDLVELGKRLDYSWQGVSKKEILARITNNLERLNISGLKGRVIRGDIGSIEQSEWDKAKTAPEAEKQLTLSTTPEVSRSRYRLVFK